MNQAIRGRSQLLQLEARELAPYATKSYQTLGRIHSEPNGECELRSAFQRDVGRITHSAAFRRLQYKTQVFSCQPDDFSRTRLTHSIAVSQIARSIARALRANEDLTEATALAHDVGHAPFGHVGENALNRLMKDHGGFEHNAHALRVVDLLEFRTSSYPGLNLTYEVREGLARHHTEHDNPTIPEEFKAWPQPSIEAQIVDLADSIAYRSHDLEDGLTLGFISANELREAGPPLWRRCLPNDEFVAAEEDIAIGAPRRLINDLIWDVVNTTLSRVEALGIESPSDVRLQSNPIVGLSEPIHSEDMELGKYLVQRMYTHPAVLEQRRVAEKVIEAIFIYLTEHPEEVITLSSYSVINASKHKQVCDAVASLTDRSVIRWYCSQFPGDYTVDQLKCY